MSGTTSGGAETTPPARYRAWAARPDLEDVLCDAFGLPVSPAFWVVAEADGWVLIEGRPDAAARMEAALSRHEIDWERIDDGGRVNPSKGGDR